jgi:hypothetical protein
MSVEKLNNSTEFHNSSLFNVFVCKLGLFLA